MCIFLPSYEKLMAAMYMGEIVRLIILDLWQKNLLFVNHRDQTWLSGNRQALCTKGSLHTKFVSEIETDSGVTFRNTKNVLQQLGFNEPTFADCAVVQHICTLVSKRAAQLAAAGMLLPATASFTSS
jgi:hexokinase